jgi:hypothetical protein
LDDAARAKFDPAVGCEVGRLDENLRAARDPLLRLGVPRFVAIALGLGCVAFAYAAAAPAHTAKRTTSRHTSVTRTRPVGRTTSTAKSKSTSKRKSTATASKSRSSSKDTAKETADHLVMPTDATDAPAYHYAQLSSADCEAELATRGIGFVRETAPGVETAVRLTGPLRGVLFRSNASAKRRETSPYELADCRLVLAMDDFAQILASHDIVEVRHYSMYRPPRNASDAPLGKRHGAALALDAGRFIDKTGAVLDVDTDFHGAIGAKTCGDGAAPDPATEAALALRAILCETAERRLFTVMLTPNYNRPHKNHFHLEVTPDVKWFLVH